MKRQDVEQLIKIAGYHGNSGKMMRLYIDNSISKARANAFYRAGQKAKEQGFGCACKECKKEREND